MNYLFEEYKRTIRSLIGLASFVFVQILTHVFPWASQSGSFLVKILSTSIIYTIVFSSLLFLYETFVWRWMNPKHNYNGFWHMHISYEVLERAPRSTKSVRLRLPYIFESVFKVSQSLADLRFSEGFSAKNEIWRDLSLRLTETGINMSYEVHRSDKKTDDALPPHSLGMEQVEVVERGWLGRPIVMEGRMYHACLPDVALYRGNTKYTRINKDKYDEIIRHLRPISIIN